MRPRLAEFGITRIAKQTNLDTLGVPCYAAIRPNSRNLSTSQGKGLHNAAAMASAIMEAVEYATAEQPQCLTLSGSRAQIRTAGFRVVDTTYLMPSDGPKPDPDKSLSWFMGFGMISGLSACIPADAIRIDGRAPELVGICQTTNGLASGNNPEEAVLHGICELIERDASTLWALRPWSAIAETSIDISSFKDRRLDNLVARTESAGLQLRLFDQTTDLGVPCIMAVLGNEGGSGRKFTFAAGYGAHPVASQAAIRAVTEAAQTRITSIAASRDDIAPTEFEQAADPSTRSLLKMHGVVRAPADLCALRDAQELVKSIGDAMARLGIVEPVVVALSPPDQDYSVVRVICPDLEDAAANINWRPRSRAKAIVEHYENDLRRA